MSLCWTTMQVNNRHGTTTSAGYQSHYPANWWRENIPMATVQVPGNFLQPLGRKEGCLYPNWMLENNLSKEHFAHVTHTKTRHQTTSVKNRRWPVGMQPEHAQVNISLARYGGDVMMYCKQTLLNGIRFKKCLWTDKNCTRACHEIGSDHTWQEYG